MVSIDMDITEAMDEVPNFQPRHLSDHMQKERIRSYIEGHSEEDICATLVEL